jgi:predicted enzyme related to lactoylglutathione lyase
MPGGLVASRLVVFMVVAGTVFGCSTTSSTAGGEAPMRIYYLEIVTKEVDAVCATYAAAHRVQFGKPDVRLGNARTADLPGGGLVGVRAPMRETEEPVVRPYWLVDDIEAAVAAVVAAGGEIAHPPMEIPGHGTFAIYFQGGIEHGLWQR